MATKKPDFRLKIQWSGPREERDDCVYGKLRDFNDAQGNSFVLKVNEDYPSVCLPWRDEDLNLDLPYLGQIIFADEPLTPFNQLWIDNGYVSLWTDAYFLCQAYNWGPTPLLMKCIGEEHYTEIQPIPMKILCDDLSARLVDEAMNSGIPIVTETTSIGVERIMEYEGLVVSLPEVIDPDDYVSAATVIVLNEVVGPGLLPKFPSVAPDAEIPAIRGASVFSIPAIKDVMNNINRSLIIPGGASISPFDGTYEKFWAGHWIGKVESFHPNIYEPSVLLRGSYASYWPKPWNIGKRYNKHSFQPSLVIRCLPRLHGPANISKRCRRWISRPDRYPGPMEDEWWPDKKVQKLRDYSSPFSVAQCAGMRLMSPGLMGADEIWEFEPGRQRVLLVMRSPGQGGQRIGDFDGSYDYCVQAVDYSVQRSGPDQEIFVTVTNWDVNINPHFNERYYGVVLIGQLRNIYSSNYPMWNINSPRYCVPMYDLKFDINENANYGKVFGRSNYTENKYYWWVVRNIEKNHILPLPALELLRSYFQLTFSFGAKKIMPRRSFPELTKGPVISNDPSVLVAPMHCDPGYEYSPDIDLLDDRIVSACKRGELGGNGMMFSMWKRYYFVAPCEGHIRLLSLVEAKELRISNNAFIGVLKPGVGLVY